jgi:Kef-type K+ transport system membrane component KefB
MTAWLIAFLLIAMPVAAAEGGHTDPVAPVVLAVAALLVAGKLAGEVAVRFGQPAVLGELVAGMILGNLGFAWFDAVSTDPVIGILAGIGVLILLFEVALESTIYQMMQVGASSFLVAALGVVMPFALGWGVGAWLLPEDGPYVHAFLGATLCATSVGITARVLQDLGASRSPEARIILGAAVVDDVMGLIILGVVSGAIVAAAAGGSFSMTAVVRTTLLALAFLGGAIVVGIKVVPPLFSAAARLNVRGVLLTLGLSLCFVLAYLANAVGLAPIVGAFAAGLILEAGHFRDFTARGERALDELLRPISDFLVPVFFVLMGLQTDLTAFAKPEVLGLAMAITGAAVIGKQVCSLGVLTPGADRLSVGIGMVPRGEVGLIFASVGAGLTLNGEPVISGDLFSAIVAMVVLTTMVTPPALKWSLARRRARSAQQTTKP